MKILFIVENYYPNISGVPVVTQYLAEGLLQRGYDVYLATKTVDGCPNEEIYNGIKITRFDIRYNRFIHVCGDKTKYHKYLEKNGFDAIIFECTQTALTDACFDILDEIKAVKILHSHGFSGMYLKPFLSKGTLFEQIKNLYRYLFWKYYYDIAIKKYISKFDRIICITQSGKDSIYIEKMCKDKKVVFGNAAEDIFFSDQLLKNNIYKYDQNIQDRYLLSVANYSDVKNQIEILESFYKADISDCSMVFIGREENEYYNKLLNKKKELDIKFGEKSVSFLTGVKREDIPGIISDADIYITGSKWEAYSISLIEAMSVGTPFISTNVGNAAELPGGITIKSMEEMDDTMSMLFADISKKEYLGNKGRTFSREFCRREKAISKLESIILDVYQKGSENDNS